MLKLVTYVCHLIPPTALAGRDDDLHFTWKKMCALGGSNPNPHGCEAVRGAASCFLCGPLHNICEWTSSEGTSLESDRFIDQWLLLFGVPNPFGCWITV